MPVNVSSCPACGAHLDGDDRFCPLCGSPITARLTNEPRHNPPAPPQPSPAPVPPPTPTPPPAPAPKTSTATVAAIACAVVAVFIAAVFAGLFFTSRREPAQVAVSEPPSAPAPAPEPNLHAKADALGAAHRIVAHQEERNAAEHRPQPPEQRQEYTPPPQPREERASGTYYPPVPCSGEAKVRTQEGSMLNIRRGPGENAGIVMQVPDGSRLFVDGWAWDNVQGNRRFWFRVTDQGGFALGWACGDYCGVSDVNFGQCGPYTDNYPAYSAPDGPSWRKNDPARYRASSCSGWVTFTPPVEHLNVRPAPGLVDDPVFLVYKGKGCKVNGWSYDQFDPGSGRVWLRLADNHSNVLGWVNAKLCNRSRVNFGGNRPVVR